MLESPLAATTRSSARGGMLRRAAPHALSLARVPLAALYVLSLDDAPIVPLGIALVACATDFADGRLARRLGATSASGAVIDVAADGCFVLGALGALAAIGRISALVPLAAALALAALGLRWARRPPRAGAPRGPADRAGHAAGILNFALVLVGSAAPVLPAAEAWLPAASVAVALVNVAPLALRRIVRS